MRVGRFDWCSKRKWSAVEGKICRNDPNSTPKMFSLQEIDARFEAVLNGIPLALSISIPSSVNWILNSRRNHHSLERPRVHLVKRWPFKTPLLTGERLMAGANIQPTNFFLPHRELSKSGNSRINLRVHWMFSHQRQFWLIRCKLQQPARFDHCRYCGVASLFFQQRF